MLVNDYYDALSKGRKPGLRKVPIYALIQWIKKYGVTPKPGQSLNQLAFSIQRNIYLNGLRGKNFIKQVEDIVTDTVELEVADKLEEMVTDSLLTYMSVK
jgi:hypothetical protein